MTGHVFFNKLKGCDENTIILHNEIASLSKTTHMLWRQLIGLRSVDKEEIVEKFRRKFFFEKNERLQMMVISNCSTNADFGMRNTDDLMKLHVEAYLQKREKKFFEGLLECTRMAVEDDRTIGRLSSLPIIFEEVCEPIQRSLQRVGHSSKEQGAISDDALRTDSKTKKKFVILVHGLGANHMRVLIFKHYFKKALDHPSYVFFPSRVNENKTMDNINSLAENLIGEVENLLHEDYNSKSIESISFVGHSMGSRPLSRRPDRPGGAATTGQVQEVLQDLPHFRDASPRSGDRRLSLDGHR